VQTVRLVNLSDKLKSYWARTKARYPNSAKAPFETSIVQKGHRLGSLIAWDEVGTTILWAAIAAGIFWWLVHR